MIAKPYNSPLLSLQKRLMKLRYSSGTACAIAHLLVAHAQQVHAHAVPRRRVVVRVLELAVKLLVERVEKILSRKT